MRDTRDQAWAQRRWGTWLRGGFAVWRANRQIPAARLPASQPTDEEHRLAAGATGERLVADALGRALDDQWVLFRGYSNRRGEIDHVLLGPSGLFAIEVKNHNATIDCYGDQWWATKYDNYGNPVGPRLTHDRAQLRSCTRPTVHVCTSVRQILNLLNASTVPVGPAERAEVVRLIVQDHHFHENRRSR